MNINSRVTPGDTIHMRETFYYTDLPFLKENPSFNVGNDFSLLKLEIKSFRKNVTLQLSVLNYCVLRTVSKCDLIAAIIYLREMAMKGGDLLLPICTEHCTRGVGPPWKPQKSSPSREGQESPGASFWHAFRNWSSASCLLLPVFVLSGGVPNHLTLLSDPQ